MTETERVMDPPWTCRLAARDAVVGRTVLRATVSSNDLSYKPFTCRGDSFDDVRLDLPASYVTQSEWLPGADTDKVSLHRPNRSAEQRQVARPESA